MLTTLLVIIACIAAGTIVTTSIPDTASGEAAALISRGLRADLHVRYGLCEPRSHEGSKMAKKVPNPIDKHVGSRVRMHRMMLGMSQGKLGLARGVTTATTRILSGF
jgi:hypothetical protein